MEFKLKFTLSFHLESNWGPVFDTIFTVIVWPESFHHLFRQKIFYYWLADGCSQWNPPLEVEVRWGGGLGGGAGTTWPAMWVWLKVKWWLVAAAWTVWLRSLAGTPAAEQPCLEGDGEAKTEVGSRGLGLGLAPSLPVRKLSGDGG
jgi:hypothetical protein